jgi:HlyD family type I secretion membrane fusion protein
MSPDLPHSPSPDPRRPTEDVLKRQAASILRATPADSAGDRLSGIRIVAALAEWFRFGRAGASKTSKHDIAPAPANVRSAVPPASADWRASMRSGYYVVFGGLGLFVAWAALTRLDGAAIAAGVVGSESNRKTIQHLEGGIVQDLLVRDGDQVKAGQLLIRLDPTRLDALGDLYENQLAIVLAQEARLIAEFENRDAVVFPELVLKRAGDPAVAPVIADQKRLFESRRNALLRNTRVAESQMAQARQDIAQTAIDIETSSATLAQVVEELESLRPLFRKQLVPLTRISTLEREKLRLTGAVGNGKAQTLKLEERLAEVELKRQQVLQDYKQDASTLLLDVRRQLSDVKQQILLTSDGKRRAEIRAPNDGTVQQLRAFTIGGVVKPGEPILDIAPANDDLVIRAKVNPNDADRVSVGLKAEIRFPGFHYWGSETIRGVVRSISRDRLIDDVGKDAYFATEVVVDKASIPTEIASKLSAGMTSDVIIVTGERSVGSYLIKPLVDRLSRSLRER